MHQGRTRTRRGAVVAACALVLVATGCGSTVEQTAGTRPGDARSELTGETVAGPAAVGAGEAGGPGAVVAGASPRRRSTASTPGRRSGGAPGAGAAAGAGASGGRRPVKIGFEYQAYVPGYDNIVFPDSKGYAETVIADLNRRGGINGHPVEPVFFAYEASEGFALAEESACRLFTEDHDVVAVAGKSFGHTDTYLGCLDRAGVPYIESGVLQHDAEDMRKFPLYFNTSNIRLDRSGPILVDALAAQGYFTPGARVGLLTYDDPAYDRATEPIRAALARHGVRLQEISKLSNDPGPAQAQMQTEVLRLKSARIDRLIVRFVDVDFFMRAAEAQQYRPAYGLASDTFPVSARELAPPAQMRGARGVGWIPEIDVNDPGDPAALGRSAVCFKLMRDGGRAMDDGNSRRIAQITCEVIWAVEEGARAAGALGGHDIRRGIESLGSSFVPASTFASRFGPGRHDGASGVRRFAYFEDCSCLRYTSGLLDAG